VLRYTVCVLFRVATKSTSSRDSELVVDVYSNSICVLFAFKREGNGKRRVHKQRRSKHEFTEVICLLGVSEMFCDRLLSRAYELCTS
jgi:hypothetical protein